MRKNYDEEILISSTRVAQDIPQWQTEFNKIIFTTECNFFFQHLLCGIYP